MEGCLAAGNNLKEPHNHFIGDNGPTSETAEQSHLMSGFGTGEQMSCNAALECYIAAMQVSNYNQKDITPIVFAKADKIQGVTLQQQLLVLLDSGSTIMLIKRMCFPFGVIRRNSQNNDHD